MPCVWGDAVGGRMGEFAIGQEGAFGRGRDASRFAAGQWTVLVRHSLGVLVLKTIVRLIGIAAVLFGLGLAGAALMSGAGELQALFGVFAMAGLLIALVGGGLFLIGALFGGNKEKAGGSMLTPQQQQLEDAREFLASRRKK
jgi:hypothetical protein